ncbi:MAG TPA: hypothetical protein VIY29_00895 [Ktedonobacteraceae bacterium]
MIKAIVLSESLGSRECAFDLRFQSKRKSSRWKPQKRLWLDNEEGMFPCSDHPSQKHQQKPIPLSVCRSSDLSTKNDKLLSQQCVFRKQFGFTSGHIGERSKQK